MYRDSSLHPTPFAEKAAKLRDEDPYVAGLYDEYLVLREEPCVHAMTFGLDIPADANREVLQRFSSIYLMISRYLRQ